MPTEGSDSYFFFKSQMNFSLDEQGGDQVIWSVPGSVPNW